MKDFYFVTSNKNKAAEASQILGVRLKQKAMELDEIQSMDLKAIVEHKVLQAYRKIKKPVFVEDVGLYIKDWNGFPGPMIKWIGSTMGYDALPKLLGKKREATWTVGYGLHDGKKISYFEASLEGTIPSKARGKAGWGWDFIFVPKGHTKTFAEIDGGNMTLKNSARRHALLKLKKYLEQIRYV